MKKTFLMTTFLIIAFLTLPSVSLATDRLVPSQYSTIQEAIDIAADGDVVIIQPGTYTGPGNYNIDIYEKEITIRSIEPENPSIVAATVIDPEYAGNGFNFYGGSGGGEDLSFVLDGLTLKRASGREYGAIVCQHSSPVIRNCVVEEGYGDGILLMGSNSIVSNCIVRDNGLTANQQYYYGYGIACLGGYGDVALNSLITNCVISGNYSSGIYSAMSNTTVANCVITGNHGAMYSQEPQSTCGGGIVFLGGGEMSVINCTISGNRADVGGGICNFISPQTETHNIDITNCIFWGNEATDGPQIATTNYYYGQPLSIPSTITVSHSDVQGGAAGVYTDPCDPCSTLNWGDGNIDVDPNFAEGYSRTPMGPVANIVSHWKLDEDSGVTADDSTGDNDGTLMGGAVWVGGEIDGALELDGIDGHVEMVDYKGVVGTQSRTVSAWIKTTTNTGSIISWGAPSTGGKWLFRVQANDGYIGTIRVSAEGGYIVGSTYVCDGRWHHVAAVLEDDGTADVDEIKLYVDGVEELVSAVLPCEINTASDENVRIGCYTAGYTYFTGLIDDVQIYDRALTNNEIRKIGVGMRGGDYHLKSHGWRWDKGRQVWTWDDVTSRCIDAGNPGSPLGDELLTIPSDPTNEYGENIRINMGAYGGTAQASMLPYDWALLADLTNDGIVNLIDFAAQADDWMESDTTQFGDLDRDGTVSFTDLLLTAQDWLKQTTWH